MEISRAEQYVVLKDWEYTTNGNEISLAKCPFCGKENHFSINKVTEQSNCFLCGIGSKTLASLKKKLGDKIDGVFDSTRRIAATPASPIDMQEIESNHQALMEHDNYIDYLCSKRGFTHKVIEQKKLGLVAEKFFRKLGRNAPALAIPYFRNGKPIYIKYRTLPPDDKDFVSTTITDLPLYNEDILLDGFTEILVVEGESDCLAALSAGIPNVIGIPGAATKKTEWITQIDEAKLERVYLCYDSDTAGQTNVTKMAEKIGIDKCYLIKLPEFETRFGTKGKDLNEFLRLEDGLAQFLKLKERARPVQIPGVLAIADILADQQDKLERGENTIPEFDTPWTGLTSITGRFDRGDVIGITANAKTGKTTVAINWLDYYARKKKYSVFMYCLEMTQDKLVKKWMSYLLEKPEIITTLVDVDGLLTEVPENNFTIDDYKRMRKIVTEMKSDYLFGFTKFNTSQDIFETIYQTKRRYGIDVVCFDNLHLLAREVEHRTSELDNLSKKFKQIAMELKILEILIMQPTKSQRDGSITSFADTRGSVAPTQDVDCGIAFSRPKKQNLTHKDLQTLGRVDLKDAFEPQIIANVEFARNASGGLYTLKFEGAISKVSAFEGV